MSDSLNNFIDKAGRGVSEKLSRAIIGKPVKVEGAKNHSGNYVGPGDNPGINRTDGINLKDNPNPSPGQVSPVKSLSENGKSYPAGFTPISYYKKENGEFTIKPGHSISGQPIENSVEQNTEDKFKRNKQGYRDFNDPTLDFKFSLSDDTYSSNWPGDEVPSNIISEKNARETFDGSFGDNPWEKQRWWSGGEGTPYENEDPIYFGFEIEIDVLTSPLINGEALRFIEDFNSNNEIASRKDILDSFIWELSRYFRFNSNKVDTRTTENIENIFETRLNKRFYIKKVSGLDKLIEANTASAQSAFVKYKQDLINLTFYEDTNLNTGTLASLYKLLYWSRLNGKNIIPENLLRFDCRIIVSEARNLTRIRRAMGLDGQMTKAPNLEVIKENVSRYVYNLYECQLFFKSMTHPASIDLGLPFRLDESYDIELSYKFSDMRFERFVFDGDFGEYKRLNNSSIQPLINKPSDATNANIDDNGITEFIFRTEPVILGPIIDGYNNFTANSIIGDDILENAKNIDKKSKFLTAVESATDNLIQNLRRAGLNAAQRQLDNKFRILNNTLDKVRNSFGIGRMAPPTNVYEGLQPGTFFFDVRNSFRTFAGDVLTGTIFGNNT
jgi:hypothetical protein